MTVRPVRRSAVALSAVVAALALAATSPLPSGSAASPLIAGPVPAGTVLHDEHELPDVVPPADIADRDTVSDQLGYARQAASLPVVEPGRAWKNVGPYGQDDPLTYPTGALRFARGAGMGAAAAVDPRDPSGDTVYIGTMGGLWRSTDAGKTYTVLGDGTFARSAIGAVALDPLHPDDVYAGTGISYLTLSGDAPGTGVYVSHDGGKTWSRPASNIKGYGVNAITPTATGVFVGTSNGLYVTTDRGASFRRVALPTNAAHTAPATGAYANWVSSVVVEPSRRRSVTVAVGLAYGKRLGPDGKPLSPGNGLYRSAVGAAGAFTYLAGSRGLTNPEATNDPIGRTSLAYGSSADHPVLWALVQDAGLLNKQQPAGADIVGTTTGRSLNATGTLLNGLYRSDDDGATWTLKATPASLTPTPNEGLGFYPALGYGIGVQAFYNNWIAVDPRDDSNVFFGLEEVFQSVANTGAQPGLGQFEIVQKYWDVCGASTYLENVYAGTACPSQTPVYGGPATHPDQHVGVIARTPKGIRLYTGNDGGFFRQDSHPVRSGRDGFDQDTWQDMNRLASVQPYRVARKPDGEYITALQDNGGGFFKEGGTNTLVTSGDGVFALATSNPDTWYLSAQGAILWITQDHGKTIRDLQPDLVAPQFTSPIVMDPTDENHLVAAAQDVQETVLGPKTTTTLDPVLYTVVATDWASSFDAGASPYKTAAGAVAKWTSQALDVRGAAVYNAMCALCRNALGDPTLIHTTVSTNVGKAGCTPKKASADCWHTAAGKGLPHVAIQAVAIDPTDVKTVYVTLNENSNIGYDKKVVGGQRVMVSHDAGEHFTDLTGNLPRSNARDVLLRNGQLIVATDNGVFTAPRAGGRWSRLGTGLPAVRIYDLSLDKSGRHLTIAAYGRGVWDLDFGAKAVTSSAGAGTGG
ncbi:MAG: hypothetical protein ABR614_01830, partial [Mycobacteriales bacterium]